MSDSSDEPDVRTIVREELRKAASGAPDAAISRRQLLKIAGGAGLLTLLFSGSASSVPSGTYAGEPGAPLAAVYAEEVRDTNDDTLWQYSPGGPLGAQYPVQLASYTSDPGAATGSIYYRSDRD